MIKIGSVVSEIWLAKFKSWERVYSGRCVYSAEYGIQDIATRQTPSSSLPSNEPNTIYLALLLTELVIFGSTILPAADTLYEHWE